jgi:hypothetical protein
VRSESNPKLRSFRNQIGRLRQNTFGLLRPALRTAGVKALTAQNRPSRLRLERNAVGFATLIADNIEALACASALARAAKILPARVPARLATLGVRQSALAVVILFSFRERKSSSTLGTRNL